MNMLGNLAGFVAPVVGGLILQKTGGSLNPFIYLTVGAAVISALCWLDLGPESAGRQTKPGLEGLQEQLNVEGASL